MTYLEAAITILRASRKPMTTGEITEAALREGLIQSRGKTPIATMSAALYVYARRAKSPTIRRDFQSGPKRATRHSVRWMYVG